MPTNELFDPLANRYDEWYKTPLGEFADHLEKKLLFRHCGNVLGKRILDVGCGTGQYSLQLANMGAHVTGIDASEDMLAVAKEKTNKTIVPIHFHKAYAEELPFEDNSFDIVIAASSLEFVSSTSTSMREMNRVLKQGGVAVIGVLNLDSIWIQSLIHQPGFSNSIYNHASFFTYPILKELFNSIPSFSCPNIESCVFVNYHPALFLEPDSSFKESLYHFLKPLKGAFLVGSARKYSD